MCESEVLLSSSYVVCKPHNFVAVFALAHSKSQSNCIFFWWKKLYSLKISLNFVSLSAMIGNDYEKILICTCLIFCLQTISRGIYNQVASQETKELKRTINFSNHNLAANSSWTTQLSVDQTWDTETDMENVDCQNIRQGRRCWAFTYRYLHIIANDNFLEDFSHW